QGDDPRGIRRRDHVRDRLRSRVRAAARSEGRPRPDHDVRQIPPIQVSRSRGRRDADRAEGVGMKHRSLVATAVAAVMISGHALSAEARREALAESKALVDWRLRYEGVDQADFATNADAFTSRLRLGVQTGSIAGTSLLAEGVWLEDMLDDYNSTTNGATEYPVVADPDLVAVNRFAIVNRSLESTVLTFGRQRIIHGNARFVGNVGWRQHEQTFDGARAEIGFGKSRLDVAYAN